MRSMLLSRGPAPIRLACQIVLLTLTAALTLALVAHASAGQVGGAGAWASRGSTMLTSEPLRHAPAHAMRRPPWSD